MLILPAHQGLYVPVLGDPLTTLSYTDVHTNNNDDGSFTIPVGASAGDLAILFDRARTGTTLVAAEGWTYSSIYATYDTNVRLGIAYKILTTADLSTTFYGHARGSIYVASKIVFVFSPGTDEYIASATFQDEAAEVTSGDPADQTISSATSTATATIAICMNGRNNATPDVLDTGDASFDASVGIDELRAYRKVWIGSSADITVGVNDNGNKNTLASCYLDVN